MCLTTRPARVHRRPRTAEHVAERRARRTQRETTEGRDRRVRDTRRAIEAIPWVRAIEAIRPFVPLREHFASAATSSRNSCF